MTSFGDDVISYFNTAACFVGAVPEEAVGWDWCAKKYQPYWI